MPPASVNCEHVSAKATGGFVIEPLNDFESDVTGSLPHLERACGVREHLSTQTYLCCV